MEMYMLIYKGQITGKIITRHISAVNVQHAAAAVRLYDTVGDERYKLIEVKLDD